MTDWNPELYLKFKNERTRPVHDLIARIGFDDPQQILDIGCGPGNSTAALKSRFPGAQIIGIDYSEAMIERAKSECPGVRFIAGDASGDLSHLGTFDLIFANASLQWLPKHDVLLRRYFGMLRSGGAIAMQIPQFDRMPISRVIEDVACSQQFNGFFTNFKTGMYYNADGLYYDVLSEHCGEVNMWATEYFHVMSGYTAIIEWISSTGMKPYIDQIPKESQPDFVAQVEDGLKTQYPLQKDGRVLFPFKRLFFIAYNK